MDIWQKAMSSPVVVRPAQMNNDSTLSGVSACSLFGGEVVEGTAEMTRVCLSLSVRLSVLCLDPGQEREPGTEEGKTNDNKEVRRFGPGNHSMQSLHVKHSIHVRKGEARLQKKKSKGNQ
jgi:hypothetical protein